MDGQEGYCMYQTRPGFTVIKDEIPTKVAEEDVKVFQRTRHVLRRSGMIFVHQGWWLISYC